MTTIEDVISADLIVQDEIITLLTQLSAIISSPPALPASSDRDAGATTCTPSAKDFEEAQACIRSLTAILQMQRPLSSL